MIGINLYLALLVGATLANHRAPFAVHHQELAASPRHRHNGHYRAQHEGIDYELDYEIEVQENLVNLDFDSRVTGARCAADSVTIIGNNGTMALSFIQPGTMLVGGLVRCMDTGVFHRTVVAVAESATGSAVTFTTRRIDFHNCFKYSRVSISLPTPFPSNAPSNRSRSALCVSPHPSMLLNGGGSTPSLARPV